MYADHSYIYAPCVDDYQHSQRNLVCYIQFAYSLLVPVATLIFDQGSLRLTTKYTLLQSLQGTWCTIAFFPSGVYCLTLHFIVTAEEGFQDQSVPFSTELLLDLLKIPSCNSKIATYPDVIILPLIIEGNTHPICNSIINEPCHFWH